MNVDTNLRELFGVDDRPDAFDQISITVASPDVIRSWSKGEVKNPETINYRTFNPENGGLFCERIFGPTRDWECACGKYKRIKHKGMVCDRCGVEVTLSSVRRERMGHIELAAPVSHIWFYKCMPSRIGLVLDISARHLERVIYYEDYVVTDPGNTPLERGQLLTENELRYAEEAYGDGSFNAGMGAEAIQDLLAQVDLRDLAVKLEEELETTRSDQHKKKLSTRLKITQGFAQSRSRPEWMIQTVLPVIPPGLRPLVPLEGHFEASDLNELYRRVINRNARIKNLLLQASVPEDIIRNEKRMLQEAVDALFDNGRHGRAITDAGNRPLKCLSDIVRGVDGGFRQLLRGKRVDFSGRSVAVPGPDLMLNQCGLPKTMALTLFEPFIIRRLKELGYCHTARSGKKLIDRKTPEVWDILAEVTTAHPVLLNRAPTLHRLSIQAFEPKLIEGEAIRVHPLVCTAYNADFDGDQMTVHVPLSVEAQLEARLLMLAPNNILSPASGRPITVPSQDIILGVYYLTWSPVRTQKDCEKQEHLPLFENSSEVEFAIASRKVGYHQWIRIRNPDYGNKTAFGDEQVKILETTPGRVRFNEIWPNGLGFINHAVGKKQISDIIWRCCQVAGQKGTVTTLDLLKSLGFREATRSGTSIGIVDMVLPEEKPAIIADAYAQVDKVTKQYRNGVITDGERYQKVVDIWTHATDTIASALYRKIEFNDGKPGAGPLFMMVDSGASGNDAQIKQLSGMRGLVDNPSGGILERPITSNLRAGLSVSEFLISARCARKVLADTELKTANSFHMTLKLVDVAHDVIVTQQDCGTASGIIVAPIYHGEEEVASLATRIHGRTSCDQVKDPVTGGLVLDFDELVDENSAKAVERIGYGKLKIRSVLTCEAKRGCCAQCYGLDLATGKPVKIGEAVGIIAAQSIGETGTELADLLEVRKPKDAGVVAKIDGEVSFGNIVLGKGEVIVSGSDSDSGEAVHLVPMNHRLVVSEGKFVKRGDQISEGPASLEGLIEGGCTRELQDYLVKEVQSVYRAKGLEIHDKHIEIIIRQMLRKVKITDPGDADQLLWGDQIDRSTFNRINDGIQASGGKPAEAEPVLLGITKASLETDSFISAASFQDTTRVLTEAATLGKVDYLTGFKENVIMGHLIPAGSGFDCHRDSEIEFTVEEPEPIFIPKEPEGDEMVIVGESADPDPNLGIVGIVDKRESDFAELEAKLNLPSPVKAPSQTGSPQGKLQVLHGLIESAESSGSSPGHSSDAGSFAGEERDFWIAPGVSLRMCWCPAGEFVMGSPTSEEGRGVDENQVKVTLSKGFWMGKYQVTQAQWQAVMGSNPSYFNGANLPVETVSWNDAQEFIQKLNARLGNADGTTMLLPTEAQWEYAARAGETGPYSGGPLDQVAWHGDNSGDTTHDMGTKRANAWGLHDMSGNVWEWCADWWGRTLPGGVDPKGPESGALRVFRGGSWISHAIDCRAANRNSTPTHANNRIGFRVAGSSVP